MSKIQFRKASKLVLPLMFLGFIFLVTESTYAQSHRSASGALDRMRGNRTKRPVPKPMGGLLGVNSNKKTNNPDCVGKLKVNIAASHSVVRAGQPYSFVALSSGGCKGTYKYQWSGTNLDSGAGKRTGLLTRNNMTASFRNLGTSTISVAVVDSRNNRASDRVVVRVLPRK